MDINDLIPSDIGWSNVLLAVLSLVIGWALSHLVNKGVLAGIRRTRRVSDNVAVIAGRVAGYSLLLLAIGVAAAFLGSNIQPLVAIIVVLGVVLILVLRGTSDNFTSGVLIQSRQTVRLGDEIQIDGPSGPLTGVICDMNARSVLMATSDGREVHVPNGRILSEVLINNSGRGARRSDIQVRVHHNNRAVADLCQLLEDALAASDHVNPEPKPRSLVESVSPSRLVLRVQFWHDPTQLATVRSEALVLAAGALEAAGLRGIATSNINMDLKEVQFIADW